MKNCLNCNSENLMVSEKESNLIPSAKYVTCRSCGNVMFRIQDTLIATPTDDNSRTKLLIQDAANCFGMEGAASLDGKTIPVEIQPVQTIESIKAYIEDQLQKENYDFDEDDCDEEYEEEEYDEYIEKEMTEEEREDLQAIIEEAEKGYEPDPNFMILLHNSGEKHMYMNTSPEFMLNIINDIKEPFSLFELKHIPLKTEVKYSF